MPSIIDFKVNFIAKQPHDYVGAIGITKDYRKILPMHCDWTNVCSCTLKLNFNIWRAENIEMKFR